MGGVCGYFMKRWHEILTNSETDRTWLKNGIEALCDRTLPGGELILWRHVFNVPLVLQRYLPSPLYSGERGWG